MNEETRAASTQIEDLSIVLVPAVRRVHFDKTNANVTVSVVNRRHGRLPSESDYNTIVTQ